MTTGGLGYLLYGARILLGKPVGTQPQRWNGIGGVTSIGDSAASVVRRNFELLGVKVSMPQTAGEVLYHHPKHGEWKVLTFRIEEFVGQPTSTPIVEVQWWPVTDIPFAQMWPADDLWLPLLINGQAFQAEIWFDEKDRIEQHDIRELR